MPFGDFIKVEGGRLESWHGLVPDIFNSLAAALNFTYTLALSPDGKFGSMNKVSKKGVLKFSVSCFISGNPGVERFDRGGRLWPSWCDSPATVCQLWQEPGGRLLPPLLQGPFLLLHKVSARATAKSKHGKDHGHPPWSFGFPWGLRLSSKVFVLPFYEVYDWYLQYQTNCNAKKVCYPLSLIIAELQIKPKSNQIKPKIWSGSIIAWFLGRHAQNSSDLLWPLKTLTSNWWLTPW